MTKTIFITGANTATDFTGPQTVTERTDDGVTLATADHGAGTSHLTDPYGPLSW